MGDKPAVVLGIGKFIQAIVDFLVIAFVIFMVVKAVNRMKREEPPPGARGAVADGAAPHRDPGPPPPGALAWPRSRPGPGPGAAAAAGRGVRA